MNLETEGSTPQGAATSRRAFLRTALAFIAVAPAIVRASSLMPIKAWVEDGIFFQSATHPEGMSNLTGFADLSEESLERLCIMIMKAPLHLRPTDRIVPPWYRN